MNTTRHVENWETVAVTALPPGWVHVVRADDGSHYAIPAPAILLQESTVTDVLHPDGRQSHTEEHERWTRAVYAYSEDAADLHSAEFLGGYCSTTTVEDFARWPECAEGRPQEEATR